MQRIAYILVKSLRSDMGRLLPMHFRENSQCWWLLH
jgi:hypothetical protein